MRAEAGSISIPTHLLALRRHFIDLRDGNHGDNAVTRHDKESLFAKAVDFLDPYARQTLMEMNESLLLGTGIITASGLSRSGDGDLAATWSLGWREQAERRIDPVTLHAFFGHAFHHPHLLGATIGSWPLNVFSKSDAAAELPTLRAIASADLHNLVFQSDYRIIPAVMPQSR
jgi:hypothetical protein